MIAQVVGSSAIDSKLGEEVNVIPFADNTSILDPLGAPCRVIFPAMDFISQNRENVQGQNFDGSGFPEMQGLIASSFCLHNHQTLSF